MAWKKPKWHGKKMKFIGNYCIFPKTVPTLQQHQANLPPTARLLHGQHPILGLKFEFHVFGLIFDMWVEKNRWIRVEEMETQFGIPKNNFLFFKKWNFRNFEKIRKKLGTRWNFVDGFIKSQNELWNHNMTNGTAKKEKTSVICVFSRNCAHSQARICQQLTSLGLKMALINLL